MQDPSIIILVDVLLCLLGALAGYFWHTTRQAKKAAEFFERELARSLAQSARLSSVLKPQNHSVEFLVHAQRQAVQDLTMMAPEVLDQAPEIVWRLWAVDQYLVQIQDATEHSYGFSESRLAHDEVYGPLKRHLKAADI